uniref:CLIP domain-containing serine protease n=1 Tax=Glossina pallidipes TaxID=7398 RepID=A0A1A9ZZ96_GLOPL
MRKCLKVLLKNVFLVITLSVATRAAVVGYGICTNPNQEAGICISIQDCGLLFEILTTNLTAENKAFLQESQCGQDKSQSSSALQVLVCCPHRLLKEKATDSKGVPGNTLPEVGTCGHVLSTRIYGGNVTKIDEFPWMTLIRYQTGLNTFGFFCGGTLINSRYVLTAGHCLKHPDMPASWQVYSVRLGEWNIETNPDCVEDVRGKKDCAPPHKDILIEYAIAHANYVANSKDQFNDIALIRLIESAEYTFFIAPICLPTSEDLRSKSFVNTTMDVAGWGLTEKKVPSSVKLKIMVDVWNISSCQSTYRTFQMPINEEIQLCAGGAPSIDTCRGDSGGPLMTTQKINGREAYYVVGVVSYGPRPCGLQGWPGVYTRVGQYINWIKSNLVA